MGPAQHESPPQATGDALALPQRDPVGLPGSPPVLKAKLPRAHGCRGRPELDRKSVSFFPDSTQPGSWEAWQMGPLHSGILKVPQTGKATWGWGPWRPIPSFFLHYFTSYSQCCVLPGVARPAGGSGPWMGLSRQTGWHGQVFGEQEAIWAESYTI